MNLLVEIRKIKRQISCLFKNFKQLEGLISPDTNTFATLNGNILTLASGKTFDLTKTVDTDTDTFVTLSGGTLTLTDGSTFDLSSTDTNTFATLNGNFITLANGDLVDITPVVDTDTNTFATFSGTVITFEDNSVVDLSTLPSNIIFADEEGNVQYISDIDKRTGYHDSLTGTYHPNIIQDRFFYKIASPTTGTASTSYSYISETKTFLNYTLPNANLFSIKFKATLLLINDSGVTQTFIVHVASAFDQNTTPYWLNPTASVVSESNSEEIEVRFSYDGAQPRVSIGTNTVSLSGSGRGTISDIEIFTTDNILNWADVDVIVRRGPTPNTDDIHFENIVKEVGGSTGLEALDEGNGVGYRLVGANPNNYGDIGLGAIDTSTSLGTSTSFGATGDYSNLSGLYNIGDDYANVSGQSNTGGKWANVVGKSNTGGDYSDVSGESNTGDDFSNISGAFNTGGKESSMSGSGNRGGFASNISGVGNAGEDLSSLSGAGNTGEYASSVSGSDNTGGQFASISGSNNTGVDHTLVTGQNNIANNPSETVVGKYATELPQDSSINGRLFTVGNGTSIQGADMRSDAFTVYRSGAMRLYPLDVTSITPLFGMIVVDESDNKLKFYDGNIWNPLF